MKYIPLIENAEEKIRVICKKRATELYGKIPKIVSEQIEWEINSLNASRDLNYMLILGRILQNKNMPLDAISAKGLIPSSITSYLLGITKANPLPPHYRCENRDFYDFDTKNYNVTVGADLPAKLCPVCGKKLLKDGFNLHKEIIFGFNGMKEIGEIELSIAKSKIPLFMNIIENMPEVDGIVTVGEQPYLRYCIIPKGFGNQDWIYEIDDNIIRLPFYTFSISESKTRDYLICLSDATNLNSKDIHFDYDKILSLFSIKPYDVGNVEFLRERNIDIVFKTNPVTVTDCIKTYGLICNCNSPVYNEVWFNNGEELIKNNKATISNLITVQEDIYENFIDFGFDEETGFKITERLHNGEKLTSEQEKIALKNGMKKWQIESYNKLSVLFSRAHVVEYLTFISKLKHYQYDYPDIYKSISFKIKNEVLEEYLEKNRNIVIPDTVTSVCLNAFDGNYNIESVTIPVSVKNIYLREPLRSKLDNMILDNNDLFKIKDDMLFNEDFSELICLLENWSSDTINITMPVKKIGNWAFAGYWNIKNVSMPESFVEIGNNAFYGCYNLEDIVIPPLVKEIKSGTFIGCISLENITIPKSVTKIDFTAFANCPELIINGERNSYAEKYAKEYNIPFRLINL